MLLGKQLIISAIFMFFLLSAIGQKHKVVQLDSLFKWSSDLGLFNGNVLVAKYGKVIYSASYGYADATGTSKLNAAYRFNIGSITKEFSAVAIMMLQEKGKLNIHDRVSAYLTDLPPWSEEVSIKDLLEYTSGLPDINWKTAKDEKDVYADLQKVNALQFKPGTGFGYNNNNVVLRQFIVEKITGLPFNSFVEQFLYKPSGMRSSTLNPTSADKNIAYSFSAIGKPDPVQMPIAGVVFVTARDLFSWTKHLHSGKLISNQSIYILGNSYKKTNGGLGNTRFNNDTLMLHEHDGQSRNYEAYLYCDMKSGLTIILMSNNKHYKLFDIASAIRAIDKNEQYRLPGKSLGELLGNKLDSLPITGFIALYKRYRSAGYKEYDFDNDQELNGFGYALINKGRLDDAIELFKLNMNLFPDTVNVYDSLAEAYYLKGDLRNAGLNYKKVLELDPNNENAKKMIEKLNN